MRNKLSSHEKIQESADYCTEEYPNYTGLKFHRVCNLNEEPLQMEFLMVEKIKDVKIQNEIGKIFRKYNIIDDKSPYDEITLNDFLKTLGYIYLHKESGEKKISLEELTLSFVCNMKPSKLMEELAKCKCRIKNYSEGIYYIEKMLIPVQIIVIQELEFEKHPALRMLSKKVTESDIQDFAEYAKQFTDPKDKKNADVLLQLANQRI